MTNENMVDAKQRILPNNCIYADFKNSELSCRVSTSSIFKLNGRKSRDNFTNLLLKIQNDLFTLTNKLEVLENKISMWISFIHLCESG